MKSRSKLEETLMNFDAISLPRRQFVKGMAMSGALLGLGISPSRLLAAVDSPMGLTTMRGKRFQLTLAGQQARLVIIVG